jgi:serine protease
MTTGRSSRRAAAAMTALGALAWLLVALKLPPALAAAALGQVAAPAPSASLAGPDVAPGRVIVKLRPGAAAIPAETARAAYGAIAVEDLPRLGAQRWSVPPGSERDVAARLAGRPEVEYAEADRLLRLQATPNDVLYLTHQWNLPKIGAPAGWDVTTGSPTVLVAIVDSGFDLLHPDAPANLRLGCDYVRWRSIAPAGACPPVRDDEHGHGTHVAGIVGARQNNALGVTGLGPNLTVMVIRVADATGTASMSDVAQAIREAADAGARVVNLSLGGTSSTTTLERAVADARERGLVLVAAAGNEGQRGSPVTYPAAYPGVLAVGATTVDDRRAAYSNVGDYVGLVAPVGDGGPTPTGGITSLYPVVKGAYAQMVGTSQAVPQAAALAGLVLSVRPTLSGAEVVTLLRATARPLGGSVPNPTFGSGQIDVRAALSAALAGQTPVPAPTATAPPSPTAPAPTATAPPSPTAPAPAATTAPDRSAPSPTATTAPRPATPSPSTGWSTDPSPTAGPADPVATPRARAASRRQLLPVAPLRSSRP